MLNLWVAARAKCWWNRLASDHQDICIALFTGQTDRLWGKQTIRNLTLILLLQTMEDFQRQRRHKMRQKVSLGFKGNSSLFYPTQKLMLHTYRWRRKWDSSWFRASAEWGHQLPSVIAMSSSVDAVGRGHPGGQRHSGNKKAFHSQSQLVAMDFT